MPKVSNASGDRILELDPRRVKPFADQPRKRFRAIAKLAESIKTVGQITPITVTASDDPAWDAELVDGERRLRACLQGGMRVRAVFEATADQDRYIRAVVANFCRQGHDAVEIMHAVLEMRRRGMTIDQIASAVGKTATWVCQYASLAKLSPAVLEELQVAEDHKKRPKAQRRARGRVSLSIALLLTKIPFQQQMAMLQKIRAGRMSMEQARTFVHREAISKGLQVGSRMSEYSKFKAVRSAAEHCSAVVDRYLNMPGVEINGLIRSASRQEKRGLTALLKSLCENLQMLEGAIAKA